MVFLNPSSWHDFFLMVGGGVAALTGLVFVAMSINLEKIIGDIGHRRRAISTLSGFTIVFIQSGLVLINGQANALLGIELLILCAVAAGIFINGSVKVKRSSNETFPPGTPRVIIGLGIYMIEAIGTIYLINGHSFGLYIFSLSMLANVGFMISGAWLLLVRPVN